jgi:hypothetical protein
MDQCTDYYARSRIKRRFIRLRAATLNHGGNLITLDDKNKDFMYLVSKAHPIEGAVTSAIIKVLRRSRTLRYGLTSLESALFPGHFHRELFEKYRPDLVITSSVGYFWSDFVVMREARKHRARSVAIVLSWDNPSSKGLGGAHADYVVAWTEEMKRELMTYLDFREDQIFVGGVAHWDVYYNNQENRPSRETFLEMFGLDPKRKIIFFGTKSPRPYPNHDIVEILAQAVAQDRFVFPCQLLVRLHPAYFEPGQENALARMMELRERFPHIVYNVPKVLSSALLLDMPPSEMKDLDAILHFSDVLVNLFSTLSIEASICDLPIVNVCFDGKGARNGYRSILVDARQVHNQRVIKTGGAALAYNPEELVERINAYLRNPRLDADGRARIVAQESGPHHGNAGRRIGEFILTLL